MAIPNSITSRTSYRIDLVSPGKEWVDGQHKLAITNGNPGSALILSGGDGPSQEFLVYPFGPDEVVIASRNSGLVMVIAEGSTVSGAGVVQWDFNGGIDQQAIRFRLEQHPDQPEKFTLSPNKNYACKLCVQAVQPGVPVIQGLTPSFCYFRFTPLNPLSAGETPSSIAPPLPQLLSSMARPLQSTTAPILTQVARIPFFVSPTRNGRSLAYCAQNTPFYELRRLDSYTLLEFFSDQDTSLPPGTLSMSREFSVTTGWSEERRAEFTAKVGLKLSQTTGVEAGIANWSCSAEVSYELGFSASISRSLHASQTSTQLINYYAGEAVAIWGIVHTFELRTANGQLINTWKTQGQDVFISRYRPPTTTTPAQ